MPKKIIRKECGDRAEELLQSVEISEPSRDDLIEEPPTKTRRTGLRRKATRRRYFDGMEEDYEDVDEEDDDLDDAQVAMGP